MHAEKKSGFNPYSDFQQVTLYQNTDAPIREPSCTFTGQRDGEEMIRNQPQSELEEEKIKKDFDQTRTFRRSSYCILSSRLLMNDLIIAISCIISIC